MFPKNGGISWLLLIIGGSSLRLQASVNPGHRLPAATSEVLVKGVARPLKKGRLK